MLGHSYFRLNARRGNVMVISVLILAAMLLGFALLGTYLSLARNEAGLGAEDFLQAKATANSCLEMALVELVQNPSYAGNETLDADGYDCFVRPIYKINDLWAIEIQTQVGLQLQRYRAYVSSLNPATVTSWGEVLAF